MLHLYLRAQPAAEDPHQQPSLRKAATLSPMKAPPSHMTRPRPRTLTCVCGRQQRLPAVTCQTQKLRYSSTVAMEQAVGYSVSPVPQVRL